MIGFPPKPINLTYSSVPTESISEFDKNSSYVLGSVRKHGNNKYIALDDIPQTVNHVWNDTDPLNTYAYDLYSDSKITNPKVINIVNGEVI